MTTPKKILMIVTSHDQLGTTGRKTGFWLEELAAPYLVFSKAGAAVDIASPKGGPAPVTSSRDEKNDAVRAFLADPAATEKLASTLVLSAVEAKYDAYFVVGGHGVMWDLTNDKALQLLLKNAFEGGRIVAAVCHGPAALVNVTLSDGKSIVSGRRVAAFSNEEEVAAKLTEVVPFPLETRIVELGARYERGPMWGSFAVRDGNLVTGQNPASSAAVAKEVLASF